MPKDFSFGGGFTTMRFSLGVLYEQFEHWQNYWTKSNKDYDLCRYTGCYIKLYRDPVQDYIVSYDRNPPFTVGPLAYQSVHPQRMLLRKHRYIIRSQLHAPRAKPYKKIRIPPPRMLCTKWFFQKDFADQTLFLLYASTADFARQWMNYDELNPQIGFITINTNMFPNPKWGLTPDTYTLFQGSKQFPNGFKVGGGTASNPPAGKTWTEEAGLFAKKFLQPIGVTYNPQKDPQYKHSGGTDIPWDQLPLIDRYATWPVRYNPFFDKGDGNIITAVIFGSQSWQPSCPDCTVTNLPLWLGLFGWYDWITKAVVKTGFDITYTLAIYSPYTQPAKTWLVPIDTGFYYHTNPFNVQITEYDKLHYYPVIKFQKNTINEIVKCGPFMPRNSGKTGWDFHIDYRFFFKWGGALLPGQDIQNPENKDTFPIPCNNLSRVQIQDPRKQGETSLFHPWDIRRGIFSERSLKRILEDSELGETLLTGPAPTEPKRARTQAEPEFLDPSNYISAQVQEADKESTSEEEEEEKTIEQQLRDNRHQQRILRRQLLMLIVETKLKQRQIAMQMGGLE